LKFYCHLRKKIFNVVKRDKIKIPLFYFTVMSRQVGVKRRAYDQSMVDQAAEFVRSGSMSLCGASKLYKIPKMTLHDRKYASSKIGAKTVLSLEEETQLEKKALHMSRIGYERTRKELADDVKRIIDEERLQKKLKRAKELKEKQIALEETEV
jgi:hypothetical protein